MIRRDFLKSLFGTCALSSVPALSLASTQESTAESYSFNSEYRSEEGLELNLTDICCATRNQDKNQFILTFDVRGNQPLTEKIYKLIDNKGKQQVLFMSPVAENQLHAVFNWSHSA